MPLPSDEKVIALSEKLLAKLESLFGKHPGFRLAHARGILVTGTFTPTAEAATLSTAPHFTQPSTPVTARFSSSTGLPLIPDTDPNAAPRGFAVRFHLGDRVHTDIISHSVQGFPARTGEDFLEFLTAIGESPPGTPSPTPIEVYLNSHPAALSFVATPKLPPTSLSREAYFGVNAVKFINSEGVSRYGRYTWTPDDGIEHVEKASIKTLGASFLFDELPQRVAQGPISFKLSVQLANDDDPVNDATIQWPSSRQTLPIGTLTLNGLAPDDAVQQKRIIYDPVPRVKGIEPTDDPLLELRAAVYLIGGKRRREAAESGSQ